MKTKNYFLYLIVFAIIVIALISIFYKLVSRPSNTNIASMENKENISTKEYSNDKFGLSFKYPDNLFIIEEIREDNFIIIITPYDINDPARNTGGNIVNSLKLVIKEDNYRQLSEDFEEKSKNKDVYNIFEIAESRINNKKTIETKYTDSYSGDTINDIIINYDENNALEISFFDNTEYKDTYENIIDNIKIK